jgi:hypothetical protein
MRIQSILAGLLLVGCGEAGEFLGLEVEIGGNNDRVIQVKNGDALVDMTVDSVAVVVDGVFAQQVDLNQGLVNETTILLFENAADERIIVRDINDPDQRLLIANTDQDLQNLQIILGEANVIIGGANFDNVSFVVLASGGDINQDGNDDAIEVAINSQDLVINLGLGATVAGDLSFNYKVSLLLDNMFIGLAEVDFALAQAVDVNGVTTFKINEIDNVFFRGAIETNLVNGFVAGDLEVIEGLEF